MNRPNRNIAWRVTGLLACLTLALTGISAAQETIDIATTGSLSGEAADPPSLAEDLGIVVEDDAIQLSLDQAIAMALNRNLSIVVQRYQRSQSVATIDQRMGIYDINLTATGGANEDTNPQTSSLQQTESATLTTEGQQVRLQASKLVSTGGTFSADLNNRRSASADRANTFNPSFRLDYDLTFSQPLLRNFGREVTEQNILIARNNADISRENFQSQVETILRQTSDTYWALVESLEQLAVAEESLSLAEDLHRMNQIQVEVGTQAPLEVVTSEARVAARRQDIIRFRAQVEDNRDNLRSLANLDRGNMWNVSIEPSTDPEVDYVKIDLEDAVMTALERRTDVRTRRIQNDTLDLNARVARNQKRPQLDLSATYGTNAVEGNRFERVGFDDEGNPILVPVSSTDFLDGVESAFSADLDGWTLGFNFGYPIGNRTAKAASVVADLAAEQGRYQLKDLEVQVLTQVRQAARAVETAIEQIESARISSNLQRRNLDAEEKRYENGLSTSFQVLEVQEDLSEARRAEVSAIISYRRALTAYHLAIGTLLDEHSVTLSDD